ncbi:MAG: hypothetical protein ABI743_14595, partial [bacterium]
MRNTAWFLTMLVVTCSAGCNAPNPVTEVPRLHDLAAPASTAAPYAGPDALLGQWDLTVDPTGPSATLAAHVAREGSASPQAKTYDIDISKFVTPDMLRVTDVSRDSDGNIVIGWRHQHPIQAPNFTLNIGKFNRADLSYTGRLLILSDHEQVAFADPPMSLDPTLVLAPDGYADTGDLLRAEYTNTAFPYVLLVDEARDNRVGRSNLGSMTGNYDVPNGGWQRANGGVGGETWTGYDYLHAGQTVTGTFTLRADALTSGPVTMGLAILAKYTDPRGLTGPTRRFPSEPPQPLDFAYRLPYAALDVGRCATCDERQMLSEAGGSVHVSVTVRDWDGTANVSTDADLSDEPNVSYVQPGSIGVPVVTVTSQIFNLS